MSSQDVAAIIVAAGSSRRMGGTDKLWLPLAGRPLLAHALASFASVAEISRIALVLSPEGLRRVEELRADGVTPWERVDALVEGGAARADSVYAGLRAVEGCDVVLIHDGARPLVTPALIRDAIAAARRHGAAIPALPVTDTIKVVDAAGNITGTHDRTWLRTVQTPQAFRYALLRAAYDEFGAERATCTDDAMLLERLGHAVATFPGDARNVKVTTPDDVRVVEWLMANHPSRPSP